jgi:hypothetical protein
MWTRKHKVGSRRNGWKCTVCDGNYTQKWGVLIEIKEKTDNSQEKLWYMTADIPTEEVLDVKAREIELTYAKHAKTAEEVFDSIPSFAPAVSTLVGVIDEEKGQYKILDEAYFNTLPKWEWNDVLTLGMKLAEGLDFANALKATLPQKGEDGWDSA